MSEDILKLAKDSQRSIAGTTSITMKLAFLQAMIEEIEKLRAEVERLRLLTVPANKLPIPEHANPLERGAIDDLAQRQRGKT